MNADPHELARFLQAQDAVWDDVQAELARGSKRSHWMWFVFPQLRGLGHSAMAVHYGLSGADEAGAYLAHPVLGARLRQACELLLRHPERSAEQIMGGIDALKLRSCLSLFAQVKPDEPIFERALQQFFAGVPDPLTLRLISNSEGQADGT